MAPGKDKEIEVKFCVLDLPTLENKLKALDATLNHPRTHEYNLRFDTPTLELSRHHRVLRLRKDHHIHMTYKGPAKHIGGVSARDEFEFTLDDFESAKKLFEALGYQVVVIYEKYRTTYELDGMIVTLDEMPYGLFVEIEGPDPENIQAAAEKLGLDWGAVLTEGYLELFDRSKKALNLKFSDLTFENFEGVEISLEALGVKSADG